MKDAPFPGPEIKQLVIERCENGWAIIDSRDFGRRSTLWVAKSPGDAAQLIYDWAKEQVEPDWRERELQRHMHMMSVSAIDAAVPWPIEPVVMPPAVMEQVQAPNDELKTATGIMEVTRRMAGDAK